MSKTKGSHFHPVDLATATPRPPLIGTASLEVGRRTAGTVLRLGEFLIIADDEDARTIHKMCIRIVTVH